MTSLARLEGEATQREMEKAVLHLLHRVRKPSELARAPYADALCRATGIANAGSALRYVVDEALAGEGEHATRLRASVGLDVIRESAGAAAARLHVSKRHFHRFRAEAVSAVAHYLRNLLATHPSGDVAGDPLENLAGLAADVEPGVAATIHRLTGAGVAPSLQLARLRAAIDQGMLLGPQAFAEFPDVPQPVVARFIDVSREAAGEPVTPIETPRATPPYGPTMRFELEYLAFLRARHRGNAFEMRTVAASLRRLAADRAGALVVALQCQADASLRTGALEDAAGCIELCGSLTYTRSDLRQFAEATMLQARIALFEGRARRCEDLAGAAYAVLNSKHRDAHACSVLIAQARLLQERPWRPSSDAEALAAGSWDRIALDAELARHKSAEGDRERAAAIAQTAYVYAAAGGFEGLAARCAGVLAGVAGTEAESRFWRADAIARLLRTRDHVLAPHLVDARAARLDPDDALVDAVYGHLCVAIPQLFGETDAQQASVRNVVAAALTEGEPDDAALRNAMAAVNEADSAFSHYAARDAADILDVFTLAHAALGAGPWGTYAAAVTSAIAAAARPQRERDFPVSL